MKIIIAGGRNFDSYKLLEQKMDIFISKLNEDIEIVSGTANGADTLGEEYAKHKKFKVKRFPANWDKYGKGAGYRRNTEMAEYADALIAFWDGQSRGTMHMINIATKKGLQVRTVRYKPNNIK